jgi:hypothetical protein
MIALVAERRAVPVTSATAPLCPSTHQKPSDSPWAEVSGAMHAGSLNAGSLDLNGIVP